MPPSDQKPEILVIIPARGGSKGIPRKNIKELCGKPLIAYSIEVALKTKLINRVIVSTEDEEIAEISKSFGAEVPFLRPADMAQDHSNIQDAFQFTLKRLQADGYCPDILVMLFPTHPFRTPALIDFLIGKLITGNNPVNTVKRVSHGNLSIFGKHEDQKLFPLLQFARQNNPTSPKPFYRESGLFLGTNRRGQNKPYIYLLKNPICLIDIDSFSDFLLAEEVIKAGLFDFNLDAEREKDGSLHINRVLAFNAEPMPAAPEWTSALSDRRRDLVESNRNIIVIPIFLENNESLWLSPEGRSLIAKCLHTAMNSNVKQKVLVLTNNKTVSSSAKSKGMEVFLIQPIHDPDPADFLPLGTAPALKYLNENKKLDAANLCILNFRNPCITNGLIDQALNRFETSQASVMLSIKKSIDHPCQLHMYYRILDAGFIHFFDDEDMLNPYLQFISRRYPFFNFTAPRHHASSGNRFYKLTKPFALDWASRGIPEDPHSKIYFRKYSDQTIRYIPIEKAFNDPAPDTASSLWIYEGPHQARVIMKISRCLKIAPDLLEPAESSLAGINTHFSFPVLKRSPNAYYFTAPGTEYSSRPRCLLRLLPVFNRTEMESKPIEMEVKDLSEPVPFRLETDDICGLAYCLMRVAEDDRYDLREPFSADQKLWSGSVKKINIKTGRVIMGRQDFPEVFEPDSTFMLIKKECIHEYIAEILKGRAKGFLMPDARSLHIKSDFDWVEYRAMLRELPS